MGRDAVQVVDILRLVVESDVEGNDLVRHPADEHDDCDAERDFGDDPAARRNDSRRFIATTFSNRRLPPNCEADKLQNQEASDRV